ncbi:MAG TPA: tetraacyldisaccharide 4'-kinase [Pyrinomonadaceae bacterium]|nr:tetraacyldisaccharide 4'-kinase [Pyrinomonadaceae bacterium]
MKLLTTFGIAYGWIMDLRNLLYDRGIFRSYSLGTRTISIGNLTTGGTGKTPLVAFVAEILAENGERVCILTRGYGRTNSNERVPVSDCDRVLADAAIGGDEPAELAEKLLGKAVVIADADRVGAAKWAKEKFEVTTFLLDDGFQHRRVRRDLDIVCVDATQGVSGMLPAGRLREPPENLRRADVVVITRADLVENIEHLRSQISNYAPSASIFSSENAISNITPLEEYHSRSDRTPSRDLDQAWTKLRGEGQPDDPDTEVRVLAFCALGNPENFFLLLVRTFDEDAMEKFDLSVVKAFPDHYGYTQHHVDDLQKQARECRIDAFVTTAKDAVKVRELKFDIPCYVVEIVPRIDDETGFREILISS